MSEIRPTGSNPHGHKAHKAGEQKPPEKPKPRPEEDDEGLFRDEDSDDGWSKKGPGSTGGYGARSLPTDDTLRPKDGEVVVTDKVDIKFPKKKKAK